MELSTLTKYANEVKDRKEHRIREKLEVDPSLMDSEWIKCPKCQEDLKSRNLEHHLENVHRTRMHIKGQGRTAVIPVISVLIVIVLLVAVGLFLYVNDERKDDSDTPSEGWLDDYTPKEGIGPSEDDWWTTYPGQNPNRGEMPAHPSWVTKKLQEGPLLILDHSEGCMPCIQQQEDVDSIMKDYGNDIQFLDLLSGSDPEAAEAFPVYDANGSPNYIPLTILITLVEDSSGNVRIGWHSTEGATGYDCLSNYVRDAIYYHHHNNAGWS
jgi:hypothetical protein